MAGLEGFGDVGKEYAAIRDDVAVWDVSPLNKRDLRGSDAPGRPARVQQRRARAEVGQARYGAFLDADGLMVDDGTVFNTGGGHCWVMTNGRTTTTTSARRCGPRRRVRMDRAADAAPRRDRTALARGRAEAHRCRRGALRYFRFLPDPVKVAGVEVYLSRTGYGGDRFELFLTDPSDAEELWNAVVGAGVTPFGAEAIGSLASRRG